MNDPRRPLIPVKVEQPQAKMTRRACLESILRALIYGLINAIVAAPTMVSYGAIVFEVWKTKGLELLANCAFCETLSAEGVGRCSSSL